MVRRILGICSVLLLGGCADSNSGLIISGLLLPDESCVYETDGMLLTRGVFDVSTAGGARYTARFLALNQLLNLSNRLGPIADPNAIMIRSAEVELRDVQNNPIAFEGLPNPFTVPAAGFVPSSDDGDPGEGIATVDIIPTVYGAALNVPGVSGTIIAVVRLLGVTAADSEVISPEIHWPIDICSGCLYACVRDEDTAICNSSCTPGQDSLTISPTVCEGINTGCVTDR